jgi:hypothetical protein
MTGKDEDRLLPVPGTGRWVPEEGPRKPGHDRKGTMGKASIPQGGDVIPSRYRSICRKGKHDKRSYGFCVFP